MNTQKQKHHLFENRHNMDMLHGSLADKLLIFALPLAVTGILQQLFNAADVAIVGQFVGSDAMAAVGSNAPVIGLLVNLFIGISLGANVVISRCTGQGDVRAVNWAVHTAILTALISGGIATLIGEVAARPILSSMSVPETIFPMALAYLRIYMVGMPVILLYNYMSAIFRSQGDTRTPLLCLIIAGLSNVGLNIFFVRVAGMSADGVALATVISNAISSALLFIFLLRSKGLIRVRFRDFRIDPVLLKQMLLIGLPAGLQGMVFSLSNISIQSAVNVLGADIMAASSAAFNVEIFVYYVMNAFGQACTTFIGQNVGAGQRDRCRRIFRISLLMALLFTVVLGGLVLLFRVPILRIFNSEEAVITYGSLRLIYILLWYPLNMLNELFSGALRGFGRSLPPALISMAGICGTRFIWIRTVFPDNPTFNTLMQVYPISWAVTAVILVIVYLFLQKKLYGSRTAVS